MPHRSSRQTAANSSTWWGCLRVIIRQILSKFKMRMNKKCWLIRFRPCKTYCQRVLKLKNSPRQSSNIKLHRISSTTMYLNNQSWERCHSLRQMHSRKYQILRWRIEVEGTTLPWVKASFSQFFRNQSRNDQLSRPRPLATTINNWQSSMTHLLKAPFS